MSISVIIIAIVGGFFAGVINTLAGNGSAITLTILTEVIGLPGTIANATNRVGILSQGLSSLSLFLKHHASAIRKGRAIMVLIVVGAIAGIALAIQVSNEVFKTIFSYLMILLLGVVLINPKRWLRNTDHLFELPWVIQVPLFLGLGLYAGFIQMGMGVLFLMVTVLIARYSIMDANAIKNVVVTILTAIAIILFQWKGLIRWEVGLTIAIGQASGGWLAAKFATQYPQASVWAYRLLIAVMILAIFKLFGWHEYFLFIFDL